MRMKKEQISPLLFSKKRLENEDVHVQTLEQNILSTPRSFTFI